MNAYSLPSGRSQINEYLQSLPCRGRSQKPMKASRRSQILMQLFPMRKLLKAEACRLPSMFPNSFVLIMYTARKQQLSLFHSGTYEVAISRSLLIPTFGAYFYPGPSNASALYISVSWFRTIDFVSASQSAFSQVSLRVCSNELALGPNLYRKKCRVEYWSCTCT